MYNNFKSNISIKIISNGDCVKQNHVGLISKSSHLIRISYNELYENENVNTIFSVLSDRSIRLIKKGAYDYSITFKNNSIENFKLNYKNFGVDYKVKTIQTKVEENKNEVFLFLDYELISGDSVVRTKIYLHALYGEVYGN